MSPMSESQIRKRRIPYRGTATIHPRDGSPPYQEEILDLSLGGLFIETYMPLEVGTVFDVELNLSPFRLRTAARVLWLRSRSGDRDQPIGMGVGFVKLNGGQKKMLYQQVSHFVKSGGRLKTGSPGIPIPAAAHDDAPSPGRTSAAAASRGWLSRLLRNGR